MNVLVTGAAGYIGSVVTEELIRRGNSAVAVDNLSQGHREAVTPEAVYVELDLEDTGGLEHLFVHYQIEAVMHLAAKSTVGDSVTDPREYYHSNVICSLQLVDVMLRHGVRKLVFSSSAAVYGQPEKAPIEETAPTVPVNPYGESKLVFEKALHWYGQAYGLSAVALRYFNAAGASERFGEDHSPETHLVPNVLRVASGQAEHLSLFGTDYPTKDGSCVRDYVHVLDIAKAHVLALQQLESWEGSRAYNLGNGEGYSVIEVIEAARRVTGADIPVVVSPRRPGDPAVLVASSRLAMAELGWQPDHPELDAIIQSAWQWQKRHPLGYGM